MGYHGVHGRGHAVHHDVKQEAGLCGGWAPEHSGAAYFAGGIVKRSAAVTAFPDGPAEDPIVEVGRARNAAAQAANPANSERAAGLVDWRGFGAHDANDTKKILGARSGFGGRGICLGWSVAAARNFPRNRQRASPIEGD